MDPKGKVAFITGGAQGLGKAYSQALLEKGAKVYFGDVDPATASATAKELKGRFGKGNVGFSVFDVTDLKSFEDAFQKAVSEMGQVDIMVNNAGVMNESIWEKMIQLNLTAVVKGTMLATEHMRKDKGGRGGRIINISSRAGLLDQPFTPVYCGTKHAVRSYTSSLALSPNIEELGIEYGVLCPGPASTDLILKADSTKVLFFDLVKPRLDSTISSVSSVVDGFLQLLQLEKMNGSILFLQKTGNTFERMEHHSVEI